MQFRIYLIKSAVNVDLLNNDEKWLKKLVRDKLMLKKRTMKKRFIENSINQLAKKMKKSIQMNDDLRQLFTFLKSSFFQHLCSQIISLRFELTEDDRISRFYSKDVKDATDSSNVLVRRKNKKKKPQMFKFD